MRVLVVAVVFCAARALSLGRSQGMRTTLERLLLGLNVIS